MDKVWQHRVLSVTTVYSVCRSFDSLLEKAFGPNGKSTLLRSATGQVLITSVGCTVLRCIDVGHSLGNMIVESVAAHHNYAGDGGKTFLLYLTSIFNSIASSAEERLALPDSEQRHSLVCAMHCIRSQLFPHVLLPAVQRNCFQVEICKDEKTTRTVMHNLVKTHLCGKYTESIQNHLSHLLVDFLCYRLISFGSLSTEVAVCIDNFDLLCIDTDCALPLSSYICDRIVIQRDFLSFSHSPTEHCLVKFILLSSFKGCEVDSVFEAHSLSSLDKALSWNTRCNVTLTGWVQKNSVNLILSTGSFDSVLHALCSKAGISLVQYVDKEDFERLQMLFHISAIEHMSDLCEIKSEEFIGYSEVCEAKTFGQKRFVCLKLPEGNHANMQTTSSGTACDCVEVSEAAGKRYTHPCLQRQLVICGMSAGACQQIRLDLLHALKILRLWLDRTWMNAEDASPFTAAYIAGGGSFELICYDAIQHYLQQNALRRDLRASCEAVRAAMLAVPLRLLLNSFQPKLATVLHVTEGVKSPQASVISAVGFDGRSGKKLQVNTTVVEPLAGKVLLLSHVLELTEQLLRVDSVLHVKKKLKLVERSQSEEIE